MQQPNVLEGVTQGAQQLLAASERLFDDPKEALFAHVLAVAVLARIADMDLDTLLDGIGCAFRDLTVGDKHGH